MSDPTGGAGERDPNAPVPQNPAPQNGDSAAPQAPQASFGDQPANGEQGGYGVGSSYGSSGDNYQAPSNYSAPGGSYEAPGSASDYQGGQSSYSGSTGSSVPSASSNSGYSTPSYGSSGDSSYSSPSAGSYTGDTSYTAPSASGSDYSAPGYGSTPDYTSGNSYGNEPSSYGSAPAPDAYGAPAQNAYGSAPQDQNAYGASAPNAYGSTPQDQNAAGAYGAAPAYGAAGGAGGGQQQYGNYAPQGQGGFNVLGLIATLVGALALLLCLIPFVGYFIAILFALVAIGLGIAGLVAKRFNTKKLLAIIGVALGGIALLGGWAITLATSAGIAQDISNEAITQVDELSEETTGELEIELTITSSGTSPVDITYNYENGLAGSDRVQVDTEALATAVPWSESVTMKYESSYGYDSTLASVSASQSDYNDQSTLSCTLTVNGTVVVEASSSSYVSCYDSNLSQYAVAE
ncbi:DUF308 domain-containing protein [Pseudoclavibacter sp. RFBB5]|uniref:DUF308 domain-containing protein n=1 Tax=Pseudoclavibacter sp. RFBB5 TaxID=2080574 RepID=UPI000CE89927|nr:DUF308 domain-containing protein [Pseudoclavibacter sp. RFBB5]PPG32145.1 hypothetical protein C5B97_03520 [Pseudoclavibacter sp. RFBB5]